MDSKKEIVFIVNPISGTHSKEFILHQIEKRLDHSLYNYTIRKTKYCVLEMLESPLAIITGQSDIMIDDTCK